MAYCTITDVKARNPLRSIGTATNPNATQVQGFIEESAGIIDSVLVQNGYSTPVSTAAATSVRLVLRNANAAGGHYLTEWAAASSDKRTEAEDMWQSALKMLGKIELDLPKDAGQSGPRQGSIASPPFFTRLMQL